MGDNMNYIKVSYKNHNKLYNIVFLIISISISLGLIVSFCLDNELVTNIYNYFLEHINNYNNNIIGNIIYPILVYLIIFILSLTILGCFMPFLALFIENMSIGLILGIILRKEALKGLLFGTIYFILTKLFYMIVLIYLTINIYKFLKTLFLSIKNKTNESIHSLYSKIIIKVLFSILVISLYNVISIFVVPKIINIFIFLL